MPGCHTPLLAQEEEEGEEGGGGGQGRCAQLQRPRQRPQPDRPRADRVTAQVLARPYLYP
jgi:hypothetical protein